MGRSIRKTVILAKVETTSGTDAAPTNTADAVLFWVENLSAKIEEQFAERDVVTGVFATPDQLPYTRRGTITFQVDLASAGTAGTAPQWGDLLIGCGCAETIAGGVSATYNDVSTALKTLTIWVYMDGELRKFAYCAGNVTLDATVGNVGKLSFTYTGLVSSVAAGTNPTPTLTSWQRPQAIGPTFTSKLILGGTMSAGAITGGTSFDWKSLQADMGNDVQYDELAQAETVAIYGRNSTLTVIVDLTVAAEVAKYAEMHTGTLTSVGFTQGTATGSKVSFFTPAAFLTAVEDNVDGNKLLTSLTLGMKALAANDSWQMVAF